jgi:hypothetical protein
MWSYDTDVPASSLSKHDPNYGVVKDVIAKIVVENTFIMLKFINYINGKLCRMSKQFVIRLSTDSFIIVLYVLWKTKNATVLVFEITDWLK